MFATATVASAEIERLRNGRSEAAPDLATAFAEPVFRRQYENAKLAYTIGDHVAAACGSISLIRLNGCSWTVRL